MPDFQHGKLTKIFANGQDLSRYFTSAGPSGGAESTETTTFGQGYRSRILGLRSGEASLEGYVPVATDKTIRRFFRQAEGREDNIVSIMAGGDALGQVGFGLRGILTGREFSLGVDDVVGWSATIEGNRGQDDLVSLAPMAARAGTGTAPGTLQALASYDDEEATTGGAVGYLHVGAVDGAMTVVIQHSPDNTAWTDLVTFAALTATSDNTAQRVVAQGTVQRYVRAVYTAAAGVTATFAVQVGRGRPGEDIS